MIVIGDIIIPICLPLAVSVPLYMLGRRLWFKEYQQAEMHTIKSGQLFTGAIFLIHMVLMVAVYIYMYF